mmetsp:Transcript_27181/g.48042  ORF Transcript_27181/g.48042 Transcript_27181/m.48042 type:complete len:219 (+) Transcript_27181:1477-2133(+)
MNWMTSSIVTSAGVGIRGGGAPAGAERTLDTDIFRLIVGHSWDIPLQLCFALCVDIHRSAVRTERNFRTFIIVNLNVDGAEFFVSVLIREYKAYRSGVSSNVSDVCQSCSRWGNLRTAGPAGGFVETGVIDTIRVDDVEDHIIGVGPAVRTIVSSFDQKVGARWAFAVLSWDGCGWSHSWNGCSWNGCDRSPRRDAGNRGRGRRRSVRITPNLDFTES